MSRKRAEQLEPRASLSRAELVVLAASRRAKRIMQKQLAYQMGITTATLSYYENGKRRPSLRMLGEWRRVLTG